MLKMIERIERVSIIINETIPKSQIEYHKKHELMMREFKEDINTNITTMRSDITLDKLNIMISEKYNKLISNIQDNILNYVSSSEDRIKTNINELKESSSINQSNQDKLNNELEKFLSQYKISSKKGQFGENLLESIITSLFPSGEIINTTGETGHGDFILQRKDKVKILLENKNYDSMNISRKEVEKFITDCNNVKCSGIMMSQRTGISSKQNYEIDINDGNVLVYIHNMNYDSEKILLACDIIDTLSSKLKELKDTENITKIPDNVINKINEQYQSFILKKESITNHLTETINMIKELELSELNTILCSKFAVVKLCNNTVYKCNKCNNKEYTTMRSLSNHKRSCMGNKTTLSDTEPEHVIAVEL
jgi:hypothetical protein